MAELINVRTQICNLSLVLPELSWRLCWNFEWPGSMFVTVSVLVVPDFFSYTIIKNIFFLYVYSSYTYVADYCQKLDSGASNVWFNRKTVLKGYDLGHFTFLSQLGHHFIHAELAFHILPFFQLSKGCPASLCSCEQMISNDTSENFAHRKGPVWGQ